MELQVAFKPILNECSFELGFGLIDQYLGAALGFFVISCLPTTVLSPFSAS